MILGRVTGFGYFLKFSAGAKLGVGNKIL